MGRSRSNRCSSRSAIYGSCLLPVVFAFFVSGAVADDYLYGSVAHTIEGDSLIVDVGGQQLEVRLWGIDSPEYDQPGAQLSAAALHRFTYGKPVRLHIKYQDRYGRAVAEMKQAGSDINEQMVIGGYSWVHPYFCREPVCCRWKELEKEAQRKRIGIWSYDDPIPPWQWKRRG
jgi:micrococcal nuclease